MLEGQELTFTLNINFKIYLISSNFNLKQKLSTFMLTHDLFSKSKEKMFVVERFVYLKE